ncbi:N-terminal acetyltransferase B complex auxiliary subunit NAA25 isoform X2 [Nicotiana tomentosiformis]|uniref:N-terminal acetyltransferase B complex auxiliary subunit NAA25 isoform X2 n=1 Tax=Nicotiana tomentosiformis TaxID=4098 RepID=UPI00051CA127|nr:N-terminal acetyltransferase B complex auxiliary subunit NAA25 isoform X1 [Nicotiana tomentosiformis]
MASKFGLAGGIPERRVRPIWDAIDSRQFKNALKHCTPLLSKYPNSPYALALKALVLERMGKAEEAFSVCLNAKELLYTNDSVLIDDLTLSTLQIVFQRLDHLDMATSCYEYACGKFPTNLDLMMGLFNCYVREYSFVKQQQIAIKMYKIVGEERFLLWAVCSIQLQVLCGNGGGKLLLLAEGLLKKHIASHSLHEPEALIVYISLLEQQSKYGDALELLTGKFGSLIMTEVDRLRLQGRLLARGGDYAAATSIFQKVLELCPDDWECFLHYLGCLLEDDGSLCMGTKNDSTYPLKSMDSHVSHLTDEAFGSRLSNASSLVQKLLTEASDDTVRCPYLANIEIERRKLLHGKGDANKLTQVLIEYFFRFGHLACFASDVETFLHILDLDKKTQLLEKLMECCEPIPTNPRKTLGQHITVFKIQNIVGSMFTLPLNELETTAVKMTQLYCENLPLSKDLDAQESMYGEDLLSMACNLLVQLFWRTRHIGYLVESIMILEFGLAVRRHIWQYKILLLHLYSHWNSLPLAYEWYKTLDVKNILLESVSHHILPQMLSSPLWADSTDILRDYLRFMDDHFRESADLTFLAYRHRSYSKVIEFVQFKERLQQSSQYLMAKIETPILQLKQKANNIEEEEGILESLKHGVQFLELSDEIGSKSLTFNEELQLRPWWTPTCDKNYLLEPFEGSSYCTRETLYDQIKQSQAKVVKTIEKRSFLPRMIYLSIQCASSAVKESVEANGVVFDPKLSSEMRLLLDRYANILGFSFQDAVGLAFDISSGLKDSGAWSCNLIDWMNFLVFLNAWNLYSHEVDGDSNTWLIVNSILKKYILDKVGSMGPLESSPGCDLPNLVLLVTEPIAWHILVIQSCARSLVPSGKRKKKGGPAENFNVQLSQELQESILSVCETIELVRQWLNQQIIKSDDYKSESILSSLLKDKEEGPGKVYRVLESLTSSSTSDADFGDRITRALQSWSATDIARKIICSQRTALSSFLKICDSKIKSLQALKAHL